MALVHDDDLNQIDGLIDDTVSRDLYVTPIVFMFCAIVIRRPSIRCVVTTPTTPQAKSL